MCLGMHLHIREVEGGRECNCGGKGNGGSIRDGGGAGVSESGCGCWCKSDGGGIGDGRSVGDGWGSRKMPGNPGRVCIGLGQDRRGEEGAGDHRKRKD